MEKDFAWAEGLGEEWLRKQRQVDIYKKESTPRECAFRHRHLSPAFRLSAISSKFCPQSRTIELVPILNTPVVHLYTDKQCVTIPTSCDTESFPYGLSSFLLSYHSYTLGNHIHIKSEHVYSRRLEDELLPPVL